MRREPLPSWWLKAKRRECEKLAKGPDAWTEIDCAVEKDDIVEHYGDASMAMFLRLFAEKVGAEVHSAWQLVFSPDTKSFFLILRLLPFDEGNRDQSRI